MTRAPRVRVYYYYIQRWRHHIESGRVPRAKKMFDLHLAWIGFCLTGPISLCVDLFVFVCISVFFCFILHSCGIIVSTVGPWGGPDGIEA